MPFGFENPRDLFITVAVFALVFAVWLGVMILFYMRRNVRTRKIEERLGFHEPAPGEEKVLSLWLEDKVATTTVKQSRHKSFFEKIEQYRIDAGWDTPAAAILATLFAVTFLVTAVVYLLTKNILPGLGCAAGILLAFWFYLKHCTARRTAAFEQQFVDALDLAARSLRAGHPLMGAFRLISDEIQPPVSTVFSEICQQQALGLSLEDALEAVGERTSSDDLRLFATSVVIQLRSGGNLAQMMDRLAFVIRDRLRLGRRLKILTAQTQFSKRLLLGLPIFVFFAMHVLNPVYVDALYTTSQGHFLLLLGASGLLLGAWILNKMAKLKY